MFHRKMMVLPLAATAVSCLAPTGNAAAATLSYEQTAAGISGTGVGTSYSHLPVADTYGNTLGPSPGELAGAPGFSFYDDYIFTVADATIDSVTSSINLGSLSISNLEERIYSITGNSAPTLGTPTGFHTEWSDPVNFSAGLTTGMYTVLNPTTLAAGTYILEIRGDVTGSNGGGYSGQIDLQPVPLPAALPLLLSGLGLFGGMARKRLARD